MKKLMLKAIVYLEMNDNRIKGRIMIVQLEIAAVLG
jgi:hypothetical protein